MNTNMICVYWSAVCYFLGYQKSCTAQWYAHPTSTRKDGYQTKNGWNYKEAWGVRLNKWTCSLLMN